MTEYTPLSSNHLSVDDQINDVVTRYIVGGEYDSAFFAEFPEYDSLVWEGAWIDPEASDVDVEYMSWVADWIESNTPVTWEEGEPWLIEGDADDEDGE